MARPRKPTKLLELSGSADHNKKRLRDQGRSGEPQPDPNFGQVPRHLTDKQKIMWRELVDEIPALVATKADRKIVELAVYMLEKIRDGNALGCHYSTYLKCLSQLGMTPADRSKISVTPQESGSVEADPMAEFLPQDHDGQQVQ